MADRFSFGRTEFDVALGPAAEGVRRDLDAPFCLVVLADFSSRANRGLSEPLGQRRAWAVDCDNFEAAMSRLDARLRLPLAQKPGELYELRFAKIEDFHPDQLLTQVAPLAAWLERRKRLLNPASAAATATELGALLAHPSSATSEDTPAVRSAESDADTLGRLLGSVPPQRPVAGPVQGHGAIQHLLQSAVAQSVVPGATPQQTALLSVLDLELTAGLRAILHHPDFQALEAAWRGLDLLVRSFGGQENLKLFLLDVSKAELAADLKAQDQLEQSGICTLIQRQAEDQSWAAWLGQFTFADTLADVETLGRLAKVSSLAKAPFLANASPALVGCDSFATHPDPYDWKQPLPADLREAWRALRELPEAAYLGLALPRFLLRQPYGKDSDPIEAFPFEELPADLPHENYLWGSPAVVCGYLLAEAFQAEGWAMPGAGSGELGDLPVHRFRQEGETTVKPCAEAWLSERAGEAIRQKGLMPLLSVKGRDAVHLAGMQSIRLPACPLAGRWRG
jgi:type VI secretion system protein ImpC